MHWAARLRQFKKRGSTPHNGAEADAKQMQGGGGKRWASKTDNSFLRAYYRQELSVSNALRSIFSWHNETMNIWTHLLGFLLLAAIAVSFVLEPHPHPETFPQHTAFPISPISPAEAQAPAFSSNWTAAAEAEEESTKLSCLGGYIMKWAGSDDQGNESHGTDGVESGARCSMQQSREEQQPQGIHQQLWGQQGAREEQEEDRDELEQQQQQKQHGIACGGQEGAAAAAVAAPKWPMYVVMYGFMQPSAAPAPSCRYCFACSSPAVKYTYISVTSFLGACITTVSLSDAFQSPALQPVRPMLFAALAGWGLAPMAHAAWTLSSAPPVRLALQLTLAQMLLIALGAVLFATRFPERLRPGRFDLLLSSHQLFHILIVLAFVMYTQACLTLWRWRAVGEGCGALP
ncbi:hypothetical protein QJQ45_014532 [Haematococcus lacustris]|nr:hypothetical protein QJQ45_014532 [Haematococcus lacustris]